MKFIVDEMPYYSNDCPFCEYDHSSKNGYCGLMSHNSICYYVTNNKPGERNPSDCPFLISIDNIKKLL